MKKEFNFVDVMFKIHRAGLSKGKILNQRKGNIETLATIEERLEKIFAIVKSTHKNVGNMLFFVMYDIESNKVRRQIVKYLERKGCIRVQKSIFLANLSASQYDEIKNDLAIVQECYENEDSILVVPIPSDYLQAMKVIGKSLNIDVITKTKSTLIF